MTEAAHPEEARPTRRYASRILVLDEERRILLFRIVGDFTINRARVSSIWLLPGGGQEGNETPEQTAMRELWEETGLKNVAIGPCVWTRSLLLGWGGRLWDSHESFYICRTPSFEIDSANWTEGERLELVEHRWWHLDEIEASNELFGPSRLATLLRPILRGELPDPPIEIGH